MTTDAILQFPRTRAARDSRGQPPRPDGSAGFIPADAWQRRFMARIHALAGAGVNAAATWPEGYAGLTRGFEADPEGAASAQLGCWFD